MRARPCPRCTGRNIVRVQIPLLVLVMILLNSAFRSVDVSVSLLDHDLTLLYVDIIYLDGGVVPARDRDFNSR